MIFRSNGIKGFLGFVELWNSSDFYFTSVLGFSNIILSCLVKLDHMPASVINKIISFFHTNI